MSLTVESVPIRVRSLLAARGQDVSNLRTPRLLALIPDALRELATQAMPSNLLRKTFTETAVAGGAPLTTSLAASPPLILEGLRQASIFIEGFAYAAQYKADRSSMSFLATPEFPYWTLENQTIVINDGTGLGNYAGDVTIRNAPYIPTLATIPTSLEHLFILILADLVTMKAAA